MISSQVALFPISDISATHRQRQDIPPDHITSLADSILRLGLINPILLHGFSLVAGQCRLMAFRQLCTAKTPCPWPEYEDWNKIPIHLVDNPTPQEIQILELEENIKRRKLSWEDEAQAVQQLHKLLDADIAATAAHLGISSHHAWRCLQVADELSNPKLRNASSIRSASAVIERETARAVQEELEELVSVDTVPDSEPVPQQIICADMHSAVAPSTKFNFIHCDFPYGINYHLHQQGTPSAATQYTDSPETFWDLCDTFAARCEELCSPSAHLMFWFSMKYYQPVLEFLRKQTSFSINPYPLIWHKSDNVGMVPDFNRGPLQIYETAFFGSQGDRLIVNTVANLYSAPKHRGSSHPSTKSESMLRHFFRMFVDEHTRMLDPTCGHGSAVRAAQSLGAKAAVGWDINQDFVDDANRGELG